MHSTRLIFTYLWRLEECHDVGKCGFLVGPLNTALKKLRSKKNTVEFLNI